VSLTVVSPYGSVGASTRVRVYHWLRHLQLDSDRHEYLGQGSSHPSILLRDPRAVRAAERELRALVRRGSDTLVLQREASPLSRGGLEVDLLRSASHSIFDFDDALQWDHGGGGFARRFAPKAAKCLAAVRTADRVIAGNDLLAEWAATWATDVVVIPSCVEPTDYRVKSDYALHDPPRIGWLGSPSAEPHLAVAAAGLLAAHRRTGARLIVLSGGNGSLGPLDAMTDRVPWSVDGPGHDMASWDLAIAPLLPSALARGKCSYKLLQYGAAGLPVLCSPVGTNARVVAGLGGVAVDHPDWLEALLDLLHDEKARRVSGSLAREHVQRHWSFSAWRPQWTAATGVTRTETAPDSR
jgi:glycosyltransferase involved in cell wall biosynthesis